MITLADKILEFQQSLSFEEEPVKGIKSMNPYHKNPVVKTLVASFYGKFYDDDRPRKMILGINPGRLGAGATGIPFTDTKRLWEVCGIPAAMAPTHEPSSVFIHEVLSQYGGPRTFYQDFYINSVCPIGFIRKNARGNWVNCNYYDFPELFEKTRAFIVSNLKRQLKWGLETETCIILGKKNAQFMGAINAKEKLFKKLVVLDHPRYIVQYQSKNLHRYIKRYLDHLE